MLLPVVSAFSYCLIRSGHEICGDRLDITKFNESDEISSSPNEKILVRD